LINQSIAINSTAFEDNNPDTKELTFVGLKTETALLQFAKDLEWENWKETRELANIIQMISFSSERKAMGVVVRLQSGHYCLFLKGTSEILTKRCTRHVVSKNPNHGQHADSKVETKITDNAENGNIPRTIIFYVNQMLRTIPLCYRNFESQPPPCTSFESPDEVDYKDLSRDMTPVAVTGIEDPLRPGVRETVATCHRAGVAIKMCIGDTILTTRSIATQWGIYTAGGIIMESPIFRALDDAKRMEVVPRLQVLARSSPEDKEVLVETLRKLGEIVGVASDGTNDGPALKTANIGFSMGIMWCRCVNDAVCKFLQFQISTNVATIIITFISPVASNEEASVLSAVRPLWINIIMDAFAALTLATGPTSESLLDRKPDTRGARLFTVHVIKTILGQSIYQVIITLVFHFFGHQILGYDHTDKRHTIVMPLVFNTFIFAQISNSIDCRKLNSHKSRPVERRLDKLNVFEGSDITKNRYFITITLIAVSLAFVFHVVPTLMMVCRNWWTDPRCVCRRRCLPGHSYPRSQVGHLVGSWLHFHPSLLPSYSTILVCLKGACPTQTAGMVSKRVCFPLNPPPSVTNPIRGS
jgi:Ca2+-transporting ATPase